LSLFLLAAAARDLMAEEATDER